MVFVILILSLLLRLISINQSLWLDEAINLNAAKSLNFADLITKYSLGDFHPPLYHLILRATVMTLGTNEIIARLPSVIFGVASVFIIFLITRKLFETKTAQIASILLATSPLHVYYSQEARMYALASFFALLSVYFFISIIRNDKLVYWVGFIFSTTLMLYSDYLPYFLLPVFVLYLIINKRKIKTTTLKAFIPAFLVILLFIFPWVYLFVKQFSVGISAAAASPQWAKVVGQGNFQSLVLVFVKFIIGRISISNDLIYALTFAPVGLFFTFLIFISLFRISAYRSFIWYWILIPIGISFLVSFYIPVFAYFRLLFVLPALYIIVASAINTINYRPLIRTFLLITLAVNLFCVTVYLADKKFQREDWREATQYVIQKSDDKTITLFLASSPFSPFEYYNQNVADSVGIVNSFNPTKKSVENNVSSEVKNKDKVFLFQYLSEISDPNGFAFMAITDKGFVNTSTKDFPGVGFVYEFRRLR